MYFFASKLSKSYTNHCLRATTIVHLKEAGVNDRRICEISGQRNTASLASYDRLGAHQAVSLPAAIDSKHVPETSVANCLSDAVHAFSKVTEPAASHSAFTLNAAGATFKNVTFNVTPAKKTKKRLSLRLKKTTERLEMKKQLSNEG